MSSIVEFPESAVLLITFNRPEQTRRVLQSLRKNKVKKLYLSNDGPRPGNTDDIKAREEIRTIVAEIDWECDIHTNFEKENLGGGLGPSSAISWAFKNEDRLIILEDDCIPAISFFFYCDELLERYKNDTRIWHISGNNYNEEFEILNSYAFSHFCHIWGWATWKRCWKSYDLYMKEIEEFELEGGLKNVFSKKNIASFYSNKYHFITDSKSTRPYTWDYQWGFTIYRNNGLCILPKRNLVKNIGYFGEHTKKALDVHDRPIAEDYRIDSHPKFIVPSRAYDLYHFKKFITRKKPLKYRIANRLKKLLSSKYNPVKRC